MAITAFFIFRYLVRLLFIVLCRVIEHYCLCNISAPPIYGKTFQNFYCLTIFVFLYRNPHICSSLSNAVRVYAIMPIPYGIGFGGLINDFQRLLQLQYIL